MTKSEKKRPRGRPAKFKGERTRGSLTIRMRDRVREDLETAAQASGRSLSEEVEYRLELLLSRRDYLNDLWGPDVYALADSIARSLGHIERHTGERWATDEKTFDIFERTVAQLLQNYRAMVSWKPAPQVTGSLEGRSSEDLAKLFASAGGMSAPRPDVAGEDPEMQFARQKQFQAEWEKVINASNARPLSRHGEQK